MAANLEALTDLCTPWCLHVAATLRVAEQLEAGPKDAPEIADAVHCDADALDRVLRHLVHKGVFEEPAPGRFALNEPARALRHDAMGQWLDLEGIGGRMAGAWMGLLRAVRTGRTAYDEVFGRSFWEDLEANPRVAASLDALMGVAGHGEPDPEVLPSGDWRGVRTVVDVGGGTGAQLAAILRAHPDVRGVLVDLPRAVARATGLGDRVTLVGQSFFDPLPAGADLYLLKNVLADWPDDEAALLLRRCAEAAQRPNGRVVVLGGVAPDGEEPPPELLMLVLVGGKGRDLERFRALARGAGLEVAAAGKLPSGRFALECRPAGRGDPHPAGRGLARACSPAR